MSDNPPLTVGQLMDIAYDQYEEFYEEPRSISYFEIETIVGHSNVGALDYVAEALNLGCDDAEEGKEKRSRAELFERIGTPDDDRWGLAVGDDQ